MNNLTKYNLDFSYKFLAVTTDLQKPFETTNAIIALFNTRKQNRLSVLKSIQFLDTFFNNTTVKRNTIRFKSKKTKSYLIYTLALHLNMPILWYICDKMPKPRTIGTKNGYVLLFNFYTLSIRVPVSVNNRAFTYKFFSLVQQLQ